MIDRDDGIGGAVVANEPFRAVVAASGEALPAWPRGGCPARHGLLSRLVWREAIMREEGERKVGWGDVCPLFAFKVIFFLSPLSWSHTTLSLLSLPSFLSLLLAAAPFTPNENMTTSPAKSSPNKAAAAAADAQTDLASARLIPLLCDSIKTSGSDAAKLSVEFPSVPGDKEKVDETGERVYEEALFHGGFDRGDRLPLEVASRLEGPSYKISGGVGGERGSPGGAAASSVFAIACVDPDAPGGVKGSSANGMREREGVLEERERERKG